MRIVAWLKPRMFCEETLGKIKHRTFSKRVGPEFYRLKALITLEQVNTTEWWEKIRILIGKTAMVGCCKLSLYANVMSVELIASSFLDLISKKAILNAAARVFLYCIIWSPYHGWFWSYKEMEPPKSPWSQDAKNARSEHCEAPWLASVIHLFIFCSFNSIFSHHSSCRKNQFTVLILILDYIDP